MSSWFKVPVDILTNLSPLEEYRDRANAPDIYEMSCRGGRADAAEFVARNILTHLDLAAGQTLVDIGCGEGTLLQLARPLIGSGRLVGILPSSEEVNRTTAHLDSPDIVIQKGQTHATGLPDQYADRVVCNNVLHITAKPELSLKELARISKPGAVVYIGEMPLADEFADRRYKSSPARAVLSALKHYGLAAFVATLIYVVREYLWGRGASVGPKKIFWIEPERFHQLACQNAFVVVATVRQTLLNSDGTTRQSPTRMNYVLRRT